MQNEIKKKVRNYAVVAVLLAVILGVLCYNLGFMPEIPLSQASFLKTFSSDAELKTAGSSVWDAMVTEAYWS